MYRFLNCVITLHNYLLILFQFPVPLVNECNFYIQYVFTFLSNHIFSIISVSTIEGLKTKETEIFNVSVSFFQFSYFVTIKLIITSTMVLIILFILAIFT